MKFFNRIKTLKWVILGMFGILLPLLLFSFSANQSIAIGSSDKLANVSRSVFELDVTPERNFKVDNLQKMIDGENIKSLVLQSNFKIGSEDMTDFISVSGEFDKLNELSRQYKDYRNNMLKGLLATTKSLESQDSVNVSRTFEEKDVATAIAENQGLDPSFNRVKFVLSGEENLASFVKSKISENSLIKSSISYRLDSQDREKMDTPTTNSIVSMDNNLDSGKLKASCSWVPNYTQTFFGDSDEVGGSNSRMYYNFSWWNCPSFSVNQTYEDDVFLYNYNTEPSWQKTYLSKDTTSWPDCFPVIQYASSNLPSPYLDTRLSLTPFTCDNTEGEVSYTIGSAKASEIKAGQWYLNYMSTSKGSYSKPYFKVQPQLGERRPSSCANAWQCQWEVRNYNWSNEPNYQCYTTWCSWAITSQKVVNFSDTKNIERNGVYPNTPYPWWGRYYGW